MSFEAESGEHDEKFQAMFGDDCSGCEGFGVWEREGRWAVGAGWGDAVLVGGLGGGGLGFNVRVVGAVLAGCESFASETGF